MVTSARGGRVRSISGDREDAIFQGPVGEVLREVRLPVVELDEERKAAMVSNLLVVLWGGRSTQPVLNTDSFSQ